MVGQAPGPRRIHSTRSSADARASYCPGRLADRARPRHHPPRGPPQRRQPVHPDRHPPGLGLPGRAGQHRRACLAVLVADRRGRRPPPGRRHHPGRHRSAHAGAAGPQPAGDRPASARTCGAAGPWPAGMPSWRRSTTGCPASPRRPSCPRATCCGCRMPAGRPVEDLEHAAETAAAFLEVREVRVARDPANARYARVVVVRRDPLAELAAMPWPHLAGPSCRCGSRSRSGWTRTASSSPSP